MPEVAVHKCNGDLPWFVANSPELLPRNPSLLVFIHCEFRRIHFSAEAKPSSVLSRFGLPCQDPPLSHLELSAQLRCEQVGRTKSSVNFSLPACARGLSMGIMFPSQKSPPKRTLTLYWQPTSNAQAGLKRSLCMLVARRGWNPNGGPFAERRFREEHTG